VGCMAEAGSLSVVWTLMDWQQVFCNLLTAQLVGLITPIQLWACTCPAKN
jgi:hypothetical protein